MAEIVNNDENVDDVPEIADAENDNDNADEQRIKTWLESTSMYIFMMLMLRCWSNERGFIVSAKLELDSYCDDLITTAKTHGQQKRGSPFLWLVTPLIAFLSTSFALFAIFYNAVAFIIKTCADICAGITSIRNVAIFFWGFLAILTYPFCWFARACTSVAKAGGRMMSAAGGYAQEKGHQGAIQQRRRLLRRL